MEKEIFNITIEKVTKLEIKKKKGPEDRKKSIIR